MIEKILVLEVVLPLLAAPVCVLVRHPRLCRLFSLGVVAVCFAIAVAVLLEVRGGGVISYQLGGWPPPLGIEYRVSTVNAYLLALVTAMALVVMSFDSRGGPPRVPEQRRHLYYAVFLLCISGLLGITITGDAFNIFVFLEISSLSSYILVSLGGHRRAVLSAFYYLVMGTIGGVFFMLGVGLLYQVTGTLNLRDIAARLEPSLDDRGTVLALALLVVGISIKLAVFPLHHWLPNAYSFAPPKVSAFLAATATKVSFYLLAMVLFTIFGAPFVFEELRLQAVLLPLSILAMFLASGAAIFQADLRRLLAYSSVAQIGYMTLGLSTANATGLAGGLVHLFNHAVMKGGLFLVVACLLYRVGSVHIDALAGIGRRMPFTSAALVIGGLSLIGVPGTVGFVSKWYLVSGVLERGWTAAAVLILLSSLLALVYVGKVVEAVYFRKPAETQPIDHVREAPLGMLAPAWVLAVAAVFFGLTTNWTYGVAREAAELLLAGGI
ncbi:MAG: monovalent cation/H+ antiporter subunit D family protein [Acidobacteriota bacterium]|nr:monovalent cation/H+ antiporter subunit D family protein [Acidobacteriota bacterium]